MLARQRQARALTPARVAEHRHRRLQLQHSYGYSNSYSDSYSYSDGYRYSDGHGYRDGNGDSSAQADAYAEASWDTAAAAIVGLETVL